ncbi:hypothetical protein PTSG_10577 [Salpingoeca rosetta]|uniref:Uncharacterized protein n=1 Tax=Salpingoeca rosetta (strain ATCC 50818 / BSB-021) TaxID=946362 RepID=F2URR7_SALR5|nr:uncharacterized protein PTSG_10577 [Salpingoeca rosetta]EGD80322.1 hypothetical protein PTSG_10577 [Salpingoeca rosetta]|eukprot:XP_004988112.1 hypothetical protein PTSG_10577 [Salpingoeca rosetta]
MHMLPATTTSSSASGNNDTAHQLAVIALEQSKASKGKGKHGEADARCSHKDEEQSARSRMQRLARRVWRQLPFEEKPSTGYGGV